VLLIACANVGQLLLARSAARRSEFALRLALGAGRARVMRQVLVEGLVLTGIGAVAGVALAYWAAAALVAYASAGQSIVLDLSPDVRVLVFTSAVSITAGLLFASAPAIRASRADQSPRGGRNLGRTRHSSGERASGRTLVVAQVALSVVLLVGAGLFVRTLQHLYRAERGIDLDRVVVVRLEPRGSGQRTPAIAENLDRLYRDLLVRIKAMPGVQSVSLGRSSPLGPITLAFPVVPPAGGAPIRLDGSIVYPRYFATIGIPIVKGRDFTDDDLLPDAAPAVLVNEPFVREVLHGREPLGVAHGVMTQGPGRGAGLSPLNIIGVVKDARFPGLRHRTRPTVYQTFLQANTGFGQMVLHVRASRSSAEILRPILDAVRTIERDVPMATVHTVADEVDAALVRERLVATLSGVFGLVALALICIGLYGLMAFTVSRRTAEIGIRMALGASRSRVRWLVTRQALTIVLAGLAIGVPVAWVTGRLAARQLSSLLYEVTATDPIAIAAAIGVLVLVAMGAASLPARRAARIDPAMALRSE
jgi:putative ABC transport system permease protein